MAFEQSFTELKNNTISLEQQHEN